MMDVYDMWEIRESEREMELQKLPKCGCCGEPITDETALLINDELICRECVERYLLVYVEDYM